MRDDKIGGLSEVLADRTRDMQLDVLCQKGIGGPVLDQRMDRQLVGGVAAGQIGPPQLAAVLRPGGQENGGGHMAYGLDRFIRQPLEPCFLFFLDRNDDVGTVQTAAFVFGPCEIPFRGCARVIETLVAVPEGVMGINDPHRIARQRVQHG